MVYLADLGLGGEAGPLIAHSIHEQISKAKGVISVGGGDDEEPIMAMLRDSTKPIDFVVRSSKTVAFWGPIIEEAKQEEEEFDKLTFEKDKKFVFLHIAFLSTYIHFENRKQRRENRGAAIMKRRNQLLSDWDIFSSSTDPEVCYFAFLFIHF
jgi:hypothetical protein